MSARRTVTRLAFVPVLAVALAVGQSLADATTHINVIAFQLAGDRPSLIDRSARAIDVVGVDGVLITENGASVGRPGKDAARLQPCHDGPVSRSPDRTRRRASRACLADGSTLWWSDARSWQLRVKLARSPHLQGLALWSLGQSDRLR